jgi:type VI secretion system protein ImpC
MSERISRSSVNLDVSAGRQPNHGLPEADTPFRILVLGDFSGRGLRGERAPLAGRRPKALDCDNLDEVLASFSPSVHLPQGTLRFRALDDFHPDWIYRQTDLFLRLADLRNHSAAVAASAEETSGAAAPAGGPLSGRSLLEQIMEQADEVPVERVVGERDALAAFIKKAVEPHLVPREDPRQEDWAARVNTAAGEQMRAILHHPHFQSLEAAWRAVAMLVDRLQPDEELKLYVFDASLEELMADAGAVEQALGGTEDPWALIVGSFAFGQTAGDVARLRWLGRLAQVLGAPFLGEALPPADSTPGPHWHELVRSAEARWLGLALPRFLLRLPYGKETSPAEQFDFEEMPESVHAHYLWGNPAFFCACVIGLAFRSDGWTLNAARHRHIEGLPQHIYRAGGESIAKPCAEVLLTDEDADFILANGLMPLASMKDRDSILLVRLQSIADPPVSLSGRWTGHN